MTRIQTLALALFTLLTATAALGEEPRWRFGTELDVVPFLSDGYSVSAIAGRGRFRGRLVSAKLTTPDFTTDDDFRDNELEIAAAILDVFLRTDQTGWWFGLGLEQWDGQVTEKVSNVTQTYEATLLTGGLGYVWRFGEHFTVNPWVGVHTPIGGDRLLRFPNHFFSIDSTPEASIKLGYTF